MKAHNSADRADGKPPLIGGNVRRAAKRLE